MNVVHHSNYLKYFERGRVEFMRDLGLSYKEIEDSGIRLIVTSCSCNFHLPATFDDSLKIVTFVEQLTRVRVVFGYKIFQVNTDKLIASGSTSHGCVSSSGKPCRMPSYLGEILMDCRL
jgi:acyl-CoA thioester hydrolase